MAGVEDGPYAVLRNRNFLIYLIGRFIASFGQQMVTVAIGWELYERTHSALALGFVGLTQIVPMFLFILPAGHLADVYNRKRIIEAATAVMLLSSAGLFLISHFGADVGWIYACLFLAGTGRMFLWPASSAFLPSLVSRLQFPRAVTWSTGSFHLSCVLGPAAGGALIAFTGGASLVYLLNAVSGLVCLALILMVRVAERTPTIEPISLPRLFSGFAFVWQNKIVLGTITLDLFAVLLGGATALLPVYAKDILHAGPQGLGALQAALPIGSLACALVMAHRRTLQRAGRTLLLAVTVFGLTTIGFGVSKTLWVSFLMLVICGAADNVSVVVRHTLVQMLTPDEKRGRVSAVNSLFIGTSNELGGFESGVVANFFGPWVAVVSGGIGTILIVALVAVCWPEIRRYGKLE